jgi:hypothetical protein
MARKLFLTIAVILYILFLVETLTGYWVWKPRELGRIFFNIIERGTAYSLHVNILPLILIAVFSIHSIWGLSRHFRKNKKVVVSFALFNIVIFLFFVYIHFI